MTVTLVASRQGQRVMSGGAAQTVPAGVENCLAIIIGQLAQSSSTTGAANQLSLAGWTRRMGHDSTQTNMASGILTKLGGHVEGSYLFPEWSSGDTIGTALTVLYLDTQGRDIAVVGSFGARNGTSTGAVTAPAITTTFDGQEVLLVAGERTTATGTTPSAEPSGFTRLFFGEQSTNTVSSHLLYRGFTPAGSTGTQQVTYSTASGNAFAMMMALAAPPAPAVPTASTVWQSDASATSLSLGWILNSGSSVRAVVSTNSDLSNPTYSAASAVPASKWVNCRMSGLQPGTRYYVGCEVDGTLIPTGRGSYKTLVTGLASSKVLASSCNNTGSTHSVFTQMKSENADFMTHMGDIHYANTNDEATWRSAFASSITSSTFAPFLASTTMTYDWDNHDTGGNGSDKDDAWATFAPEAVRQLTGSIYPHSRGMYRTWVHAGVRYIEIDRWLFRNDQTDADVAGKTMLGADQLAWFTNLLQTATEPAIVVMAGFPLYSNLIQSGRWGSYTVERQQIASVIDGLKASQRDKLVFIAGDSHAVHADDGRNAMWNVPSLNASPLNQTGGLPSGVWNIGNIDVPDTSGYYSRLTWTYNASAQTLTMLWEAVDHTGAVALSWTKVFDTSSKPPVFMKDDNFAKGRRRVFRRVNLTRSAKLGTAPLGTSPLGGSA